MLLTVQTNKQTNRKGVKKPDCRQTHCLFQIRKKGLPSFKAFSRRIWLKRKKKWKEIANCNHEALIITELVKTKIGVILFLIELMFVPCSKKNCSNFKRETTAIHTTPPVTKIISAKNVGARVSNSFHIQLIFISKENWKKKVVGTILDLPAQPIRPIKLVNSGWIGCTN